MSPLVFSNPRQVTSLQLLSPIKSVPKLGSHVLTAYQRTNILENFFLDISSNTGGVYNYGISTRKPNTKRLVLFEFQPQTPLKGHPCSSVQDHVDTFM
jgi:hypothetical protein